jgi:hypothetical protein
MERAFIHPDPHPTILILKYNSGFDNSQEKPIKEQKRGLDKKEQLKHYSVLQNEETISA